MTQETNQNIQDQNQVPKKTDVQFIKQLQSIYREIGTLEDDLKEVKDSVKDAGYNPALLAKVAKALVDYKADEIIQKNDLFAQLVDKVDGNYDE